MQRQNSEKFFIDKDKRRGKKEMVKKSTGTENKVGHVLRMKVFS